jgi:hypothetical protein
MTMQQQLSHAYAGRLAQSGKCPLLAMDPPLCEQSCVVELILPATNGLHVAMRLAKSELHAPVPCHAQGIISKLNRAHCP